VRGRDDVRARRSADTRLRPAGALSLARALSKFGVCSRREAERWIAAGRVSVNGTEVLDPARWVRPGRDRVQVDGREVADQAQSLVIALHKPVGVVTTRTDPGGRPTVYDVLGETGRWVFPVGRLDRDSSGLLILTNDHRLGEALTSPEAHVPKTYHVLVAGVPDAQVLRALREGVPLEDGTTRPARVRLLGVPRRSSAGGGAEASGPLHGGVPQEPGQPRAAERARPPAPVRGPAPSGAAGHGLPARKTPSPTEAGRGLSGRAAFSTAEATGGASCWLEIVLTEGRNRQVRRMCAALGHEVQALVRVAIGGLTLAELDLAPGESRQLEVREMARLTRTQRLPRGAGT
jgi:pseudouridine synthase